MATESLKGIRNEDLELNKIKDGRVVPPVATKPKDPSKKDPPKWALQEVQSILSANKQYAENPFQYYGLAFSTKEAIEPKMTNIMNTTRHDPSTGIGLSNDVLKDIRASSQSTASKLANGFGKFAITAGTSFIENAGYLYNVGLESLYNLIDQDDNTNLATAWSNNLLARWGADVRERAEKWMPNYRDRNGKGNWADFLADNVLKTAGFMVGMVSSAVIPGGSMGLITKLGAKGMARLVLSTSKNIARAKKASRFTAEFLGSLHGAMTEAAVESVTGANDWENSHIMDLDDKLRRGEITQDEYNERREFLKAEKVKMGNAIYAANTAYLTLSNYFQLGRALGGKYTSAARFIQQIKKGSISEIKKNLAKPITKGALDAVMEGFEEGNQKVFQLTAGIAAERDYNRYFRDRHNYKAQSFANAFLDNFMRGITDAYKDSSTWEEVGMGALIGFTGAPVLKRVDVKQKDGTMKRDVVRVRWAGGVPMEISDYMKDVDYTNDRIRAINNKLQNMEPYYRNLILKAAASEDMNIASWDKDKFDFKNAEFMNLVSDISLFTEVGKQDILKDLINEWGLDEQQSVDDIMNAGYAELSSDNEYDKNVKSVFFDQHGNARNRNEVVAKIKAAQEEILNLIDKYTEVREDLEYMTNGVLDSEQLSHLTWMKMQVGNWLERAEEMYGKEGVKDAVVESVNIHLDKLREERQKLADKGEKTDKIDKEIKFFENILTVSEDNSKLGYLLASNPNVAAHISKYINPEKKQVFTDYIRANTGVLNFTTKVEQYVEHPEKLQEDLIAEYNKIVEQQTEDEINRVTGIYSKAPNATNAFVMMEHLDSEGIFDSSERILQKLKNNNIDTVEFEKGVNRYKAYKEFVDKFDKTVDHLSEKYNIELYKSQEEKEAFDKFVRDKFLAGYSSNSIILDIFGQDGPIDRAKNNKLIKIALQAALQNAKVATPDNTNKGKTPAPEMKNQTEEEKRKLLSDDERELTPETAGNGEGTIEEKEKRAENLKSEVEKKKEALTKKAAEIEAIEKESNPTVEQQTKLAELKEDLTKIQTEIDETEKQAETLSGEVNVLKELSDGENATKKLQKEVYKDAEEAPPIADEKDTNTLNPDSNGIYEAGENENENPYQKDGDANLITNWRGYENLEYEMNSLKNLHTANVQSSAFIEEMKKLNAYNFVNKGLLASLVAFNRKKGKATKVHIVASIKNKNLWTTTEKGDNIPRKLLAVEIPEGFNYTGKTIQIGENKYQIVGELGGKQGKTFNDVFDKQVKQAGHEINAAILKNINEEGNADWVICENTWNYVRKIYGGRFVKAVGTKLGNPIRNLGDVMKGNKKLREVSGDSHKLMVVAGDKDATLYYDTNLNIHNLNRFARGLKGSVWLLAKQSDGKWYPRYTYVKTAYEWFNDIRDNASSNAVYQQIDNLCRKMCNAVNNEQEATAAIFDIMNWIYFGPMVKNSNDVSEPANRIHINQNKTTGKYVVKSLAFDSFELTGNIENDVAELKKRLFDKNSRFRMNVAMHKVQDTAYCSSIIKSDVLKTDLLQVENVNASFDMFPEYADEDNRKKASDAEILNKSEQVADETYADPNKYSGSPLIQYNGNFLTEKDIENLPEDERDAVLGISSGVAKPDKSNTKKGAVYSFENNGVVKYYYYISNMGIIPVTKDIYKDLSESIENENSKESKKAPQVVETTGDELFDNKQQEEKPIKKEEKKNTPEKEVQEPSGEPSYEEPVKKPQEESEVLTEQQQKIKDAFDNVKPGAVTSNKSKADIVNTLKKSDKDFPFFDYMLKPQVKAKTKSQNVSLFDIYIEIANKIKEGKISQDEIDKVKDIGTFMDFLNNLNCR